MVRSEETRRGTDSPEPPLPTFVIIGAQKSATRWLRLNLGLHPDVYAAPNELEFFNSGERFQTAGVSWYRAQFEGWSGEPFVGEATPGYMFWRHHPGVMAERIQQVVPDGRLVAILRNPVDRAQSAMIHHIAFKALPPDTDLLDLIRRTPPERDPLGIVAGGWYAASLEPFQQRFGDQLLVLLHDDCDDDPRGVYDRALRHLGAAPTFVPPELERVRFSNREGAGSAPDGVPSGELTLEQRCEVYEFFAADISKLERMLGRDLSLWSPERPSS
ncbi:MAG: sulfotransferase family protein [Acidimicrobiia bacterium]